MVDGELEDLSGLSLTPTPQSGVCVCVCVLRMQWVVDGEMPAVRL